MVDSMDEQSFEGEEEVVRNGGGEMNGEGARINEWEEQV